MVLTEVFYHELCENYVRNNSMENSLILFFNLMLMSRELKPS
jgi:hypothetical protein